MTYTEVYDPRHTERVIANEINRAVRHCRVGKIRWKRAAVQPFAPVLPDPRIFGPYIDPIRTPIPTPIPSTGTPYRPNWWDRVTCKAPAHDGTV
jgi:hypothetical protein